MINLKHVPVIQTIAREGSITAASKKLFVSQPALSQLVKNVETELGAPLFERGGNRLKLTHAGELYLNSAHAILTIDNNLRAQIADSKDEIYDEFRLGISTQRGLQLLPFVVPRFTELYPHVKIVLHEEGSDILEQLVMRNQCDVAFLTTTKKSNGLRYVLIENERIVLIAAKNTDLARRFPDGSTIDITDAQNEKFISMNSDHSIRQIQNRLFEENNLHPHIILETHNMEAAKSVAAHAGAVFLIPHVYVPENVPERSMIHIYNIANVNCERHYYFCCQKDMYINRYQKDFLRIVCEQLRVPYALNEEPI